MIDKFQRTTGQFLAWTGLLLAGVQLGAAQTATTNSLRLATRTAATSQSMQNGATTRTLRGGGMRVESERGRYVVNGVTTSSLRTIANDAALRSIDVVPVAGKGLRLNFRGATLDTVLDYLGKAAGFTIVREAQVGGRIDVYSDKSLSKEEAVEVLHTVLMQRGYAAVLNENTLKIIPLSQAMTANLPVVTGSDPVAVKKTDEMVIQIIPVRYASAAQIIRNLEPLMPSYATISSNDGSNAVVLTATKSDVRRMMEIIKALDTSLTTGSSLKVFLLNQASAEDIARLITDLFRAPAGSTGGTGGRGGNMMAGGMPFPQMMFGMGGGGGRGGRGGQGAAMGGQGGDGGRATAYQVTAVADSRTNSVVVSAPEEMLPTIENLIKEIDQSIDTITEIRVFPLRYAEAQNTAQLINDVFQSQSQGGSSRNSGNGAFNMMQRFMGGGGRGMMGGMGTSGSSSQVSRRNGQASTVYATPDIRTNAVVVNADKILMEQVAAMVEQLDSNPAKDRKVFVYPLKYADPQQTSQILESMFSNNGSYNRNSSYNRNNNSGGIFNQNNSNTRSSSRNSNTRSSSRGGSGGMFN